MIVFEVSSQQNLLLQLWLLSGFQEKMETCLAGSSGNISTRTAKADLQKLLTFNMHFFIRHQIPPDFVFEIISRKNLLFGYKGKKSLRTNDK